MGILLENIKLKLLYGQKMLLSNFKEKTTLAGSRLYWFLKFFTDNAIKIHNTQMPQWLQGLFCKQVFGGSSPSLGAFFI